MNYTHNDTPVTVDSLEQEEFIAEICEIIKNCIPPKSIGINGYWGAGKTSALLQIKDKLNRVDPLNNATANNLNEDIITVWFEAWRYQSESVPIVALLQEIREQLGKWYKITGKLSKIGKIVLLGVFDVFATTMKIASISKISAWGRQMEADNWETPLASQDLHKLLEEAVEKALNPEKDIDKTRRMVIFIDDLDRCQPDVALKLLEGIKVYLNLKNCVLVFGMDQRQIEIALQKALGGDDAQAREYLEKICQDIHHLPVPNIRAKANYLLKLLENQIICNKDESNGQYPGDTEKEIIARNHRDAIKNVLYTYDCLPANPRKIKALSNRLALKLRSGCIKGEMSPLILPNMLMMLPLHLDAEISLFAPSVDISFTEAAPSETPVEAVANETLEEHEAPSTEASSNETSIASGETLDRRYMLLIAMSSINNFHRELNEQLEKNPEYINQVVMYAQKPETIEMDESKPAYDPMFKAMKKLIPSFGKDKELPTNPSDGNVFRLHKLFIDLNAVDANEIKAFLDSPQIAFMDNPQ